MAWGAALGGEGGVVGVVTRGALDYAGVQWRSDEERGARGNDAGVGGLD